MKLHQRFVAHIDILGMSTLSKNSPELAWETLSSLVQAKNDAHQISISFIETAETINAPDLVKAVTFSDTIFLFSKQDTLNDLRVILIVATEILNKALNLCVPVRAGITHGTCFINPAESMYAGPALVEAYEIGEAAQWIGIRASKSVYEQTKRANFLAANTEVIKPAVIPVEGGHCNGYAVDWPAMNPSNIKARLPVSAELVYSGFSRYFGPYDSLPSKVKAKYENTAKFINESLATKT
jgi:hypothetical protein